MNENEPPQILHIEPRWPVALTILVVLGLLVVLPDRIRLFPAWFVNFAAIAILVSITAVPLTGATARWRSIERTIMLFFIVVVGSGTIVGMASLIREMVIRSKAIDGLLLLSSSVGMWISNVLTFSLLYWQIDRGGPEARMNDAGKRPDWLFLQTGTPEGVPPDWRPTFVDYLYLAFSTAMAFSPTDAMPLTSRTKIMVMIESSISLATIVVVAARAISILGN
ncbi:DUF1345 domain-containing protein [Pseudanabaena sp. PCC 6802]|uniref:DUF1345 domain-containing protein n=1 Tax=Pseudanabaena sp. PCC 6802 TaxID=118173 RepID=UPI0003451A4E|nr:DUF1345 domain-containing protein [Pseudanabaena sp. PCC 6802]